MTDATDDEGKKFAAFLTRARDDLCADGWPQRGNDEAKANLMIDHWLIAAVGDPDAWRERCRDQLMSALDQMFDRCYPAARVDALLVYFMIVAETKARQAGLSRRSRQH